MDSKTKLKVVKAMEYLSALGTLLREVQPTLTGRHEASDFAAYLLVREVEETLNKGDVHTKLLAVANMAGYSD
jgi:hypothetical protein